MAVVVCGVQAAPPVCGIIFKQNFVFHFLFRFGAATCTTIYFLVHAHKRDCLFRSAHSSSLCSRRYGYDSMAHSTAERIEASERPFNTTREGTRKSQERHVESWEVLGSEEW